MALAFSNLGALDKPEILQHEAGVDLQARLFDVTIGTVSADYVSSNGGLAIAASAVGMNTILFAQGAVRASSATAQLDLIGVWDATNKGMKFVARNAAGSAGTDALLLEIVASDKLADGDIVRVFAVGV